MSKKAEAGTSLQCPARSDTDRIEYEALGMCELAASTAKELPQNARSCVHVGSVISLGTMRSDSGLRSLTLMLCRRSNRWNMVRERIRGLCDAGSAHNISREAHGPLALLRSVWQQTPRHAKILFSPSLNNLYMQVRPIFRNVASASRRI